jgi:hypothetical protein
MNWGEAEWCAIRLGDDEFEIGVNVKDRSLVALDSAYIGMVYTL